MTYKELSEKLAKLPQEQLQQTVTVHWADIDEHIPVLKVVVYCDGDVLDDDHIVLATDIGSTPT